MNKKILLTGGHAGSTAYSLIQEIKKNKPTWNVVFVGAKIAIEGSNQTTLENTYFPKMGIKFVSIVAGRIQRKFTFWTIPSLLKIPFGFLHALIIVIKEHPDVVVSFGGFSAFPVVVIAKLFGIPVIVHEQTIAAGRSNIASAVFADKIALARNESIKFFPKDKCLLVGNPISQEVVNCVNKKKAARNNSILITGGSRGSLFMNEVVKSIIPALVRNFIVYHQTGNQSNAEFEKLKTELDKKYRDRYIVFPTVEMRKMANYLQNSDFIISRSGANIVSETVYLSMPSIFIPIPYSYQNEQYENAMYAKKMGLAYLFDQDSVKPDQLYKKIIETDKNWELIVQKARKPQIDDSKASEKLFQLILNYA
jgi:UDP-N-acetylglucosamine--N-acetylmuramyl-(pentapeptide) pyrophosphoryl-undecaprenol N-acetylglucosamine transferase